MRWRNGGDAMNATAVGERLGKALRRLRLERGVTLAELSRRTGIHQSSLSRAERNAVALSCEKLARIGAGLGVDVAALFADEPRPRTAIARRAVTRAGETREGAAPAADLLHKRLEPVIRAVRAADVEEAGGLQRLAGEAYVFVIEGEVDVLSDAYAPLHLGAGDSLYFDAAMPHAFVRSGESQCRILCVTSQP
jgi:transcriptional regulator with XRE-family HTH domain